MKITVSLLAVLVGLLSIAAGVAKVMLTPGEVEFLRQFGFNNALTISFGLAQVLAGLLLLIPVGRLYGSLLAAGGFALSAILILTEGNVVFAGVSVMPVLIAAFVAHQSFRDLP